MAVTQIKNGWQGGSDDQLKVNPDGSINVNGGGSGSNASVGVTGTTAPTSATEIAGIAPNGNLTPVAVTSGGAIDVNVVSTGSSGTVINQYNEVTSVAMGSSATVLTYTVPNGNTFDLTAIEASSDSISIIVININGATNAKQRTFYTNYNLYFPFYNLSLVAGTVITVVATNESLQGFASFNASLQGSLN